MNFFEKAQSGYDLLVNMIIRPPRSEYSVNNLGPKTFRVKGVKVTRRDFDLTNERGHKIKCSHYISIPEKKSPCVIYLHGNCGSRLEARDLVPFLLPSNISLFSFDFSACGQSDGEYISLGYYEKDDVKTVVNYLRNIKTTTTIGIWGRSMGAATAIMYSSIDPSIASIVVDSPFSSLVKLAEELASSFQLPVNLPKIAIQIGLKVIRKSVLAKANFDIEKLSPQDHVQSCFIPALFAHGKEDDFIRPSHCQLLHELYQGDKNIILMEGDHNSERPKFFHDSVVIFFINTLFNSTEDYNNTTNNENEENEPNNDENNDENSNENDVCDYAPKGFEDFFEDEEGVGECNDVDDDDELLRRALLLSLEDN